LNEFIDYDKIAVSPSSLKQLVRDSFRLPLVEESTQKERVAQALHALKQMNELTPILKHWKEANMAQTKQDLDLIPQNQEPQILDPDESWTERFIQSVEWLPNIRELSPNSLEIDNKFPFFPLSGPLYSPPVAGEPLPLFSNQVSVSIPGMDVPLKIFEARYRQLYAHLLQLPPRDRVLVVPFAHPTERGTFARVGLMYELTRAREVADDTNGVIQYLAHHVITKPIQIERILNPQVYSTRETYLQVEGKIVYDDQVTSEDLEPVKRVLEEWRDDANVGINYSFCVRALYNLRDRLMWGLVHSFHHHWQKELLRLELTLADQARASATERSGFPSTIFSKEVLLDIQKPYRARLLSLQLQLALTVPNLLQLHTVQAKVNYLVEMVQKERDHYVETMLEKKK
jgi:hypothetical protein